jgi:hypothetical protein
LPLSLEDRQFGLRDYSALQRQLEKEYDSRAGGGGGEGTGDTGTGGKGHEYAYAYEKESVLSAYVECVPEQPCFFRFFDWLRMHACCAGCFACSCIFFFFVFAAAAVFTLLLFFFLFFL